MGMTAILQVEAKAGDVFITHALLVRLKPSPETRHPKTVFPAARLTSRSV